MQESNDAAVVISASGMATGGRVLHHLIHALPDARNTVLFAGYQAAGTRGRALLEGAHTTRIHGQDIAVHAQIERLDSMSAHADANEIMRWLGGFTRPPALTCLVHGEPGAHGHAQGPHRARAGVDGPDACPSGENGAVTERRYMLEQVDDAAVVQYYADGFSALPLDQKILAWHLYRAALAGRDIYYDQRYRHALEMREILEEIVINGDDVDPATMREIWRYTKLFWINSGPHNNITARKFVLTCTPEAFRDAAEIAEREGAHFPRQAGRIGRRDVRAAARTVLRSSPSIPW